MTSATEYVELKKKRGGIGSATLGARVASVVLAVLAPACGNAPAGAPPHTAAAPPDGQRAPDEYEVSWHPSLLGFLGPQAVVDTQQSALEARLDAPWEDALRLTNGERTVEARSCRALLDLDDTYETVVLSEFSLYQSRGAQCRAAALLARARPSKASFLHGFALDAQAPNQLPAALTFSISPDDDQRISQAVAEGKPWSAVEEVHLLDHASASEASYAANGSEQALTILGHGDVNGDGVEDLLLLSRGRLTEGSLKIIRVLLLTRESASESTLRLLP